MTYAEWKRTQSAGSAAPAEADSAAASAGAAPANLPSPAPPKSKPARAAKQGSYPKPGDAKTTAHPKMTNSAAAVVDQRVLAKQAANQTKGWSYKAGELKDEESKAHEAEAMCRFMIPVLIGAGEEYIRYDCTAHNRSQPRRPSPALPSRPGSALASAD